MLLDDLVAVIETLKGRIQIHGASLRENEYRTRLALIDPLLRVLGWDVSDPAMVTPEYDLRGQKADYALLSSGNTPAALVEAKRLGEPLTPHRMQMVNYANMSGVSYAGLTDGSHWEFYRVFDPAPIEDRLILNLFIANVPAHEAALKLLLLWQPNLASGNPVTANDPALVDIPQPGPPQPDPEDKSDWRILTNISHQPGHARPVAIRFLKGEPKGIRSWDDIWIEVCEWLVANGKLADKDCPVPNQNNRNERASVNTVAKHPDGSDFATPREISTGLFIEINYNPTWLIRNSRFLLERQGVAPADVELRFE